jgi:hypothetical protein
VCGVVKNSEDNKSSSWNEVRAYYPENINQFSSCEVSPENNKYCCDVQLIPPVGSWRIGKIVFAEVYDSESGYVAGPVSIATTGEGYDVLPEMQLEKVLNLYSPLNRIILSNQSSIFLNLTSRVPYNFIEFEKDGNKSILCSNCSEFEGNLSSGFGMNALKIFAKALFLNRTVHSDISFAFLNFAKSSRNLEKVRSGRIVEMKINVSLSHPVENLELREYVPVEWEIINVTSGLVKGYSASHQVIIWNVSENNFVKSYYAKSPSLFFFPKKYVFKTELENVNLSEDYILVYKLFSFFSSSPSFKVSTLRNNLKRDIGPLKPLVIKNKGKIDTFAIFPNKEIKDVEFELIEDYFENDLEGVIQGYRVIDNLKKEDIDKMFIEFKLKKNLFNNFTLVKFYILNDFWSEMELNPIKEDKDYYYYSSHLNLFEGFAFVEKK